MKRVRYISGGRAGDVEVFHGFTPTRVMSPQQIPTTPDSKRLTDEANKTNINKLHLVSATSSH